MREKKDKTRFKNKKEKRKKHDKGCKNALCTQGLLSYLYGSMLCLSTHNVAVISNLNTWNIWHTWTYGHHMVDLPAQCRTEPLSQLENFLMCIVLQTHRKESCVWLQEARDLKRARTDQITVLQCYFKHWTQYCPNKGNYSFIFNWTCLATFQRWLSVLLVKKNICLF